MKKKWKNRKWGLFDFGLIRAPVSELQQFYGISIPSLLLLAQSCFHLKYQVQTDQTKPSQVLIYLLEREKW